MSTERLSDDKPRRSHEFIDRVTGKACTLHVAEGWIGVEHPGCDHPADVALSIDAFFCRVCTHNGRISGAWAADKLREVS